MLTIQPYYGAEVLAVREEIARLRIEVFRDFPYLYDGDLSYELTYLQKLVDSATSLVLLVRDGSRAVGATTAIALDEEEACFRQPFLQLGEELKSYCYFGESVLLPEYRGRGYGHRFFDERERHATALGKSATCFCSVLRESEHPAHSTTYRPLEPFWRGRGYLPIDGVIAEYPWRGIGEAHKSVKRLQVWVRAI